VQPVIGHLHDAFEITPDVDKARQAAICLGNMMRASDSLL
jgi:hypothetical protein